MSDRDHLYGLTPEVIEKIQGVFARFDAIDSVVLYGSRAKGTYRVESDIDLTLKTNGRETNRLLFDVIGAIEALDLVHLFDISLFSEIIDSDLIDHINRVGIAFYQRDHFMAQQAHRQKQEKANAAARETEHTLETRLIAQLETLGFDKVRINDETALLANLKKQLEKHNKTLLSDLEFRQILNKLSKGNIFEKAKILRDKVDYIKDDGETGYIEMLNQIHWCKTNTR